MVLCGYIDYLKCEPEGVRMVRFEPAGFPNFILIFINFTKFAPRLSTHIVPLSL